MHGVASPVASRHSPGLACSLRLRLYCGGGRRDEKKSDERLLGKKGYTKGKSPFFFFEPPSCSQECGAIVRAGLVVEEPLHCHGRSTVTHELKENTG